ncbi:hypothetical protein [Jannaschia sp. R86511]|uniref:hypothetical protein n=1 Tax=Jannaschia sp. R86511 TaxID=3093853 RepID=UPI0036D215BA
MRARRSKGARLRRALLSWALHSVGIVVVVLLIWSAVALGPVIDGPNSWRQVLALGTAAPVLAVLTALVPLDLLSLAPTARVWRRLWRSVRLSRPSARRAWRARYGHLNTANAWDLWGATGMLASRNDHDEALHRERADHLRARRERRERRRAGRPARRQGTP